MKKFPFQFRVEPSSGIFLVCWCVPWIVGLVYMLWFGEFNWGVNNESEVITRADKPVFYWSVVTVVVIMIGVVLRLTFERRTNEPPASNSEESNTKKSKQKTRKVIVGSGPKPPRRKNKKK